MPDLQLDLLPMSYYNTLGFDKELIDYIEFVDDSFVYDLISPLYKKGGRIPHNPITMFRAHYLYFTKNEISSYRDLERNLEKPQNQNYRNFIFTGGSQRIPSHNSMSDFRAKVGVELFYQILFKIIAQALKLNGFLNPTLTAVDSRPLFANVGRPGKTHCNCADKKKCSCPKIFTDPDAAVGSMRNKTNMNKYFVGYRKHTIVSQSKQGPVPHGSQLHKEFQKFRKQVELNFAIESNSLDSVMRHKKLPVRRLPRVEIFSIMADTFRLIKLMIRHMQDTAVPEGRDKILEAMKVKHYAYPASA